MRLPATFWAAQRPLTGFLGCATCRGAEAELLPCGACPVAVSEGLAGTGGSARLCAAVGTGQAPGRPPGVWLKAQPEGRFPGRRWCGGGGEGVAEEPAGLPEGPGTSLNKVPRSRGGGVAVFSSKPAMTSCSEDWPPRPAPMLPQGPVLAESGPWAGHWGLRGAKPGGASGAKAGQSRGRAHQSRALLPEPRCRTRGWFRGANERRGSALCRRLSSRRATPSSAPWTALRGSQWLKRRSRTRPPPGLALQGCLSQGAPWPRSSVL